MGCIGVHELEWKRCPVGKNPDLWDLLKGIKTKLQAIETAVTSPEPASGKRGGERHLFCRRTSPLGP